MPLWNIESLLIECLNSVSGRSSRERYHSMHPKRPRIRIEKAVSIFSSGQRCTGLPVPKRPSRSKIISCFMPVYPGAHNRPSHSLSSNGWARGRETTTHLSGKGKWRPSTYRPFWFSRYRLTA
jgi:hypothetical protein